MRKPSTPVLHDAQSSSDCAVLVTRLPSILNVGGMSTPVTPQPDANGGAPSDAGRDTLLQIYARVPFDLFKAAVENRNFPLGTWRCASSTRGQAY